LFPSVVVGEPPAIKSVCLLGFCALRFDASAEKLETCISSSPLLRRRKDRRSHTRVHGEVSAMKGARMRKEIKLKLVRVAEVCDVDVRAPVRSYGGNRAQCISFEDVEDHLTDVLV